MSTPASPTLVDLALKYRSDKGVTPFAPDQYMHEYVLFYEKVFAARRQERLNILDIGAWGENQGGSTLMWREYFPNAHVYALDYWGDVVALNAHDRVTAFQCNLDHEDETVDKLAALNTRFDIVVEDASHHPPQQMRTLFHVSSFLNPFFQYIIEDIGAGGNRDVLNALANNRPFPHLTQGEWNTLVTRISEARVVRTRPSSTLLYIT